MGEHMISCRCEGAPPWWHRGVAVAAVMLLVAIVAAIALTMRRRPDTRKQNPGDQVQVKKADRLRIVKMDAEEKQS